MKRLFGCLILIVALSAAGLAQGNERLNSAAAGAIGNGVVVPLGNTTDAKCPATDATPEGAVCILKELSFLLQNALATTTVDGGNATIGAKGDPKSALTDTSAISVVAVLKELSFLLQNTLTVAGTIQPGNTANTTPWLMTPNDGAGHSMPAGDATGRSVFVRTDATPPNANQPAATSDSTACASDIGCEISDALGNKITSNSTTYTAKHALDENLLGTLGTGFSTPGKVDTKSADGDNATIGAKTDTADNHTDATGISVMAVLKEISKMAQAPPTCSNKVIEPTASDNHQVVQNGASIACSIVVFNNSATVNYGRIYNAGTGFNGCNSATNLAYEFQIPASTSVGGFVIPLPQGGLALSSGLSVCITGAFGQTDTTSATATAISANFGYR